MSVKNEFTVKAKKYYSTHWDGNNIVILATGQKKTGNPRHTNQINKSRCAHT